MSTQKSGAGHSGQAGISNGNGANNATYFLVRQILATFRTSSIVQVTAVHGGGVAAIGTVDVLPLINMVDGLFQASKHDPINSLPFVRVQGGGNAVICDPQVGDIGVVVFCDRDISVLKATATQGGSNNQAAPGSRRSGSFSDGIYLFSMIANAPTQYVEFTASGIEIHDKNSNVITMGSAGVNINGLIIDAHGNLTTPGGVQAGTGTADAVALQTHQHPTAATGSPSAPTPGT